MIHRCPFLPLVRVTLAVLHTLEHTRLGGWMTSSINAYLELDATMTGLEAEL